MDCFMNQRIPREDRAYLSSAYPHPNIGLSLTELHAWAIGNSFIHDMCFMRSSYLYSETILMTLFSWKNMYKIKAN